LTDPRRRVNRQPGPGSSRVLGLAGLPVPVEMPAGSGLADSLLDGLLLDTASWTSDETGTSAQVPTELGQIGPESEVL
jgi:hypothetical protein